jgi:ligand-binding sensor domain-containing protein
LSDGTDSSNWTVHTLLLDRHGALWVGTLDEGIYRFYAGKVENFREAGGLSSDTVNRLYEDGE